MGREEATGTSQQDQITALREALARSDERFERMMTAFESKERPDSLAMAGLSEAKIHALTAPPKPQKFRTIPGRSEETGATFNMVVVESKAHATGRVVRLENYRHPKGVDVHQAQQGLVPDGHPIYRGGNGSVAQGPDGQAISSMLDPLYKQWRWENFMQADLRAINGKPLSSRYCLDPKGMATPWLESSVTTYDADAAE